MLHCACASFALTGNAQLTKPNARSSLEGQLECVVAVVGWPGGLHCCHDCRSFCTACSMEHTHKRSNVVSALGVGQLNVVAASWLVVSGWRRR